MSFILDALRKSEHERQRSTVPGLAQVPHAAPAAQMPRWALILIGVLAAAVLVLGGAWWHSTRSPAEATTATAPRVQRNIDLPPPASAPASTRPSAPSALSPPAQTSLAAAATSSPDAVDPAFGTRGQAGFGAPAAVPVDSVGVPSAAALLAQGVALPPLRLELHAFSEQARDRFVFINGRKYVEGDRLIEGPQLLSIEPRGAVLAQGGQRFRLVQE